MQSQNDNHIISVLDKIIQHLHDDKRCFKDHIENVQDIRIKHLFIRLIDSREQMISEIQNLLQNLGHKPVNVKGTLLGTVHKAYENLKSALTRGDPLVISKEIKRGGNILVECYKEVFKQQPVEPVRELLINHVNQIETELKQVDLLSIKASK